MQNRLGGLKPRQLLLLPLIMTIFFDVSGGPYGLETAVSGSGAGMALLLLLVAPIIWSLPAVLMTAELTAAIPSEGGFYVWVREAMGPFAAFLTGWWSWVYSWVDISIYPGLFIKYVVALMNRFPALAPYAPHGHAEWAWSVLFLAIIVIVNIIGTRASSETNVVLGILLLLPFVAVALIGIAHLFQHPVNVTQPLTPAGQGIGVALGGGLLVVMWNYMAWDSLSPVAGETDRPERTFPRALLWALPLVACAYILPTVAGLSSVRDITQWQEGAWPAIAESVGGSVLGLAVAIAAIWSVLGMFNATLLGGSRLPFVLAEDGYLPQVVAKAHPRFGTPWVAILISAFFAALLAFFPFSQLVTVDVLIYSAGLIMEFAALVVLRYKRPDLARPFRIKGGKVGVWLTALVPTALVCVAFAGIANERTLVLTVLGALASGPLVYGIAIGTRKAAQTLPHP